MPTSLISEEFTASASSRIAMQYHARNLKKQLRSNHGEQITLHFQKDSSNPVTLLGEMMTPENCEQLTLELSKDLEDHLLRTPFFRLVKQGTGIKFPSLAQMLGVLGDPHLCEHTDGSAHTRSLDELYAHAGLTDDEPCHANKHRQSFNDDITHAVMMATSAICTVPYIDRNSKYRKIYDEVIAAGQTHGLTLNPTTGSAKTSTFANLYRNNPGRIEVAKAVLADLYQIAEEHHEGR